MNLRPVAALAIAALAGACAGDQRAADQARCSQYGFAPGSEAYSQCLMVSDLRREDQNAAQQRATARRIEEDNARTSAEFRERLMAPSSSAPPLTRDPFAVPGGLQIPAPPR